MARSITGYTRLAGSIIGLIGLVVCAGPVAVRASTTDGTIDAANKYAWGEKIGWVNFGTSGGDVHVTDSALTGYAWSENYGWINLAPSGSGVANNGEGTLSGSAWGENIGYIDFSSVVINSSGQFTGYASSSNTGQINFDCSNCTVTTDWRPASSRSSGSGGTSGGGGGGTGGGGGYVSPSLSVRINGGAVSTPTSSVSLALGTDGTITHIFVSNFADLHDAVQEPFVPLKQWNLCFQDGRVNAACPQGIHAVYVIFYSSSGGQSWGPFSAQIYYGVPPSGYVPPPPPGAAPSGKPASFLGRLYDLFGNLIPDFLKPSPGIPPVEISVARLLPKIAPFSMRGRWVLLPREPIRQFVFAPLPKDLHILASKFSSLQSTFKSVGIARQSDVTKLRGTALHIPGFAESALPAGKVRAAKLAAIPLIPLVDLPASLKREVPSEVVFVRTGDEKIDLPVSVSVNDHGVTEQRVTALARTILKLVVKPNYPAKQVIGYLAFRSRATGKPVGLMPSSVPLNGASSPRKSLFASAVSSLASLVASFTAPPVEERFTLRQFAYTDPDGDGIYTAIIQAPVVDGSYDIYTVIDYEDPRIANNELKLTAVVDPEGYIYEAIAGKELRIPGAVVSMMWLDPEKKQYVPWPAESFSQENPQVTDIRGTYAFLVPPGFYSLSVDAPGYNSYHGKPFEVVQGGSGIHINIELSSGKKWLDTFDWKTVLLILLSLLGIYNFYADRKRRHSDDGGQGAPHDSPPVASAPTAAPH